MHAVLRSHARAAEVPCTISRGAGLCRKARCNMIVYASSDQGASWGVAAQAFSLEAAAYSTLVQLNDSHAALVYERGGYR